MLFDASGTDLDHIGKPIPFKSGQKVVTGQDQWTSKFWKRFYQVGIPIDGSEFSDLSRGMVALLTELPPKNWTGGEGALRPTFLSKEVWYNARHETSA